VDVFFLKHGVYLNICFTFSVLSCICQCNRHSQDFRCGTHSYA